MRVSTRLAVLERASDDISAGRLWKARDRLTTFVKAEPANQEGLELLGEVHLRMGDHPSAGRFWLLTERSGPEVELALQAFEERWGSNLGEKLKMVPAREPFDAYPPSVRARIDAFAQQAREAGIEWPPGERTDIEPDGLVARDWIVLAAFALLGPGLWLLGIAVAIYLLIGWLG